MSVNFDLTGKLVLITGSSSGTEEAANVVGIRILFCSLSQTVYMETRLTDFD